MVNEERIARMCGTFCELRRLEWKGNGSGESDEMCKNECDNKEESMWNNNRKPYVMQRYLSRIGMIERRQHLAMTTAKRRYFLV